MPTLRPRSSWTTHARPSGLVQLVPGTVIGTAIHWPGTTGPIGDPGVAAVARRLDGYRGYHTAAPPVGRGWSDIAYQVGFDQAGRVWDLRGLAFQSAANGTSGLNRQYVAALFLVGPGEAPTDALVEAFRWFRTEHILSRYPKAKKVVGHGDIRPSGTECPGAAVGRVIRAGTLAKAWRAPEDQASRDETRTYVLNRYLRVGVTGKDVEAWQKRINRDLDVDVRVDGDFGPKTEDGTQRWQRKKHIADDGVVGAQSCRAAGDWTFRLKG